MSTKGKIFDVAVVGEIYVDHVFSGFKAFPGPGEEVITDAYAREVGGGAATTACGLARLGRKVNLLGLIGRSDTPFIGQRLKGFGVATAGLKARDGVTGVSLSVSTLEDRSFFTHIGVNADLSDYLSTPEALDDMLSARHVHFSMPLAAPLARAILPKLAKAGRTTSLDVGYQPRWLSDRANVATLRQIDHFLPNEKEAELFCQVADHEAFFARARAVGLKAPMLKLGARGAMAEDASRRYSARPPKVQALDTTGAGDAFNVGFIDALLDQTDPLERLQRACVSGALSTRVAGALAGLPDRKEFRSTYAQTYQR